MSWGVELHGKPRAILRAIDEAFIRVDTPEPEGSFRLQLCDFIKDVLVEYPPDAVVKIFASGTQSNAGIEKGSYQTLSLIISPIHGFIE